MAIGCNLELSLRLGSGNESSSSNLDSTRLSRVYSKDILYTVEDWFTNTTQNQQEQQQARSIISMARQAMEEKKELSSTASSLQSACPFSSSPKAMPAARQQIARGHSMKRSLQQFMQRRKTRIDASSPYIYK